MIGVDADGRGGLGLALTEMLPAFGWVVEEVVGVGGSTLGHWLKAAGQEGHYTGMPGRWSPVARNPLSKEERDRASLERLLLTDGLGLVWVNLGTNDAASLHATGHKNDRDIARWVEDAVLLVSLVPAGVAVIWTVGNGETGKPWDGLKAELLEALSDELEDHGATVLGPRGHYLGAGVHPTRRAHVRWIEEVAREAIPSPSEVQNRGWPFASWLLMLLAGLLAMYSTSAPVKALFGLWGLSHGLRLAGVL